MSAPMKFTPGPWQATRYAEGYWYVEFGMDSSGIGAGVVIHLDRRRDGNEHFTERCEADTKLIAASPTMLDALRLVSQYEQEHRKGGHRFPSELVNAINGAIALAEGRL